MRFFEVEGGSTPIPRGPLRIVAERVGEGNLEDPTGHRPTGGQHVTEAELLAMDGGRQALETWRAGDDSTHERVIADELAIARLDDELEGRV